MFGQKIIQVKIFVPKKILVPKEFWVRKILLGPKKFWVNDFFWAPWGIGLSPKKFEYSNPLALRKPTCQILASHYAWNPLKSSFDGRQPLTEDDLWWMTTFDGRRPLTEDDLWRKTTFDSRQPLTEDDHWRKTTFNGRRQWGRPEQQSGLAYCWKAHGAGHIPLWGIFQLKVDLRHHLK